MNIDELSKLAYDRAKEKGWWDDPREVGTLFFLINSELVEAFEEWRVYGDAAINDPESPGYHRLDENGKPEGFWSEIADVFIRLGDFIGRHGEFLEPFIKEKMEFNKTRDHLHGGKHA